MYVPKIENEDELGRELLGKMLHTAKVPSTVIDDMARAISAEQDPLTWERAKALGKKLARLVAKGPERGTRAY